MEKRISDYEFYILRNYLVYTYFDFHTENNLKKYIYILKFTTVSTFIKFNNKCFSYICDLECYGNVKKKKNSGCSANCKEFIII